MAANQKCISPIICWSNGLTYIHKYKIFLKSFVLSGIRSAWSSSKYILDECPSDFKPRKCLVVHDVPVFSSSIFVNGHFKLSKMLLRVSGNDFVLR